MLATNGAHWPPAAQAAQGAPAARPGGSLRLSYGAEPASLDPAKSADSLSADFVGSLFAGLVRGVGPNLDIEPDVATHWQVSADGRTYRFFLRPSGWSDGVALTAADFVFSIRRALDPTAGTTNAPLLFGLQNAERCFRGQASPKEVGVRAIDAHTLEFLLEAPQPWFLQLCTHAVFKAVPAHVVGRGQRWPKPAALVTSGPFAVEFWRFRERVRLRPNPHHWRAASLGLARVDYLFVPRPDVGMALYQDGELDVSPAPVPLAFGPWALLRPAGELRRMRLLTSDFFWCNTARPPLDDVRVRQALNLAIDRAQLASRVVRWATPAVSLVPPAIGGAPWTPAALGLF